MSDHTTAVRQHALRLAARLAPQARAAAAFAMRHRPVGFQLAGSPFRYFSHPYNATWRNERAVEVPIVLIATRTQSPSGSGEFPRHDGR